MDIIYSIGDGAYLATVLNAVAAITAHSDFGNLVRIGFILGVLLVSFQAILTAGREWRWDQFVVAVLVYMIMFGPKMTVHVHDVYNGSTRTVDNVPIGVGMVGSLISTVGKNITEFFEVGFSMPQMLQGGFGSVIHHYLDTRNIDGFGTANSKSSVAGGPEVNDLSYSIYNYVRDCTMTGVVRGEKSMEQIENASDVLEAIRWESNVWGTSVKLGLTGTPATTQPDKSVAVTCNEAYQKIYDRLNNDQNFQDAYREYVDAIWGGDAELKLQTSLDFISEATNETYSAMKHMINSSMRWQVQQAALGHFQQNGNEAMATMMGQAIEQRAIQWTAEASLFSRLVRPLQTFFEAFLFSITPFMALLIGLGTMGIKMIGKYLLFGLWIQLWLPVMAIINLFLNVVVQSKLGAIDPTGLDVTSLRGFLEVSALYQDYLTTAGMLAASVPAITLLLIYGSSITATSLAGRLQSGDFINEKQLSPDIVQPAAATQMASMAQSDFIKGTSLTGAQNFTPSMEIGSMISGATKSASQFASDAQNTFSKQLTNAIQQSNGSEVNVQALSALGSMVMGSKSTDTQAVRDMGAQAKKDFGLSDSGQRAVTGVLAAMASGQLEGSLGSKMLTSLIKQTGNVEDLFERSSDTVSTGSKADNSAGTSTLSTKNDQVNGRSESRRTSNVDGSNKSTESGVGVTASAGVSGRVEESDRLTAEQQLSRLHSFIEGARFSSSDRAGLLNQVASNFSQSSGEQFKRATTETQAQTLTDSAQDVLKSSETFDQWRGFEQRAAQNLQTDPLTVLAMLGQNSNRLMEHAGRNGFLSQVNEVMGDPNQTMVRGANGELQQLFANSDHLKAFAYLKAMDSLSGEQRENALQFLAAEAFTGTPLQSQRANDPAGAFENQTLGDGIRSAPLARPRMTGVTVAAGDTTRQVGGMIESVTDSVTSLPEHESAVALAQIGPDGLFKRGDADTRASYDRSAGEFSSSQQQEAYDRLSSSLSFQGGTTASRAFGLLDQVPESVEARMEQGMQTIDRVVSSAKEYFASGFSADAAREAWNDPRFQDSWNGATAELMAQGRALARTEGLTGAAADYFATTYTQDVIASGLKELAEQGIPVTSMVAKFATESLGYGRGGQEQIDDARERFVEEQRDRGTPEAVISGMVKAIDKAYMSDEMGAATIMDVRAILSAQERPSAASTPSQTSPQNKRV